MAVFRWPRRLFAVLILCGLLCQPLAAQASPDLAGTWQGTLETGKGMRVMLKISRDSSGWHVLFYSIDLEVSKPRRSTAADLQGQTFQFAIAPMDGSYEGKLSTDAMSMTGTWMQSGHSHPLNLLRANSETAWPIPQPDRPMAADADPEFEVATVKLTDPDWHNSGFHSEGRRIFCDNQTLNRIMSFAYGIHVRQIAGAPAWFSTDKYTIDGVANIPGRPSLRQMQAMYRKLLADRFHLALHREAKELPVYALRVASGGPKLTESLGDPNGQPDSTGGPSSMRFTNNSMAVFVLVMQLFGFDRPVVDRTALTGRYDFYLKWTPDGAQTSDPAAPPSIFTAMQEQLGLKLEPVKAPTDVLVIDHVERPSQN